VTGPLFSIEFSSQAVRFLKKADAVLARWLFSRIEQLGADPFPSDMKRVVHHDEKVFRVRVGEYRIEYAVIYEKRRLVVTQIEKRAHAYD